MSRERAREMVRRFGRACGADSGPQPRTGKLRRRRPATLEERWAGQWYQVKKCGPWPVSEIAPRRGVTHTAADVSASRRRPRLSVQPRQPRPCESRTPSFSWSGHTELVYVLESFYEVERTRVAELVRAVIGFPAVAVVDVPLLLRALEVYELARIDFAEAYLVRAQRRARSVRSRHSTAASIESRRFSESSRADRDRSIKKTAELIRAVGCVTPAQLDRRRPSSPAPAIGSPRFDLRPAQREVESAPAESLCKEPPCRYWGRSSRPAASSVVSRRL